MRFQLFGTKECISITWDSNKNIYGVVLKKDADKYIATSYTVCNDDDMAFPDKLSHIYKKLYSNQDQHIIIGGYIPSAVCIDCNIPPLSGSDINQYLYYELSRQIPFAGSELKWWYRKLPTVNENKDITIRIFSVFEKEWDDLLCEIALSKIKMDSLMYPFMAINPICQNHDIILPGIDKLFYINQTSDSDHSYMKNINLTLSEDQKIKITNSITENYSEKYPSIDQGTISELIPALLLAEYAFTQEFQKDSKLNINLPIEFRPKRFKSLKISAIVILVIFLVISSSYIIKKNLNIMGVLGKLNNEQVLLQSSLKKMNYKKNKNKKYNLLINEIADAIPETIEPIIYIEALQKLVPSNIWMTSFASNKNKLNITLQTKNNAGNLIDNLNKSTLFKTQNVRKRRTSDGTQYIYITLEPRNMSQRLNNITR